MLPPEGFPLAFHLDNLIEVYTVVKNNVAECSICSVECHGYCKKCRIFLCQDCDKMHKRFGSAIGHDLSSLDELATLESIPLRDEEIAMCPEHKFPLKFFCHTCDELVCCDCTMSRNHKDHDINNVVDSYYRERTVIESKLKPINKLMSDATNILNDISEKQTQLRKEKEMAQENIHAMVESLIDSIRETAQTLTEQVDADCCSDLDVLSKQKELMKTKLQSLTEFKKIQELGDAACLKELCEKGDTVQLIKNEPCHVEDISYKIKKVKCHQIICEKQGFSFPLSLELSNSLSLLTVPLSSLSCSVVSIDNTPINTTVTTTEHPGVYRIHCSPMKRGPFQVNVQINNVQLESTSLVIPFNPYLAKHTSICTIDGFNRPNGVAVSDDGHVIVAEYRGNCITVLDREGKKVKLFTSSEFSCPCGVAITPDNFILVTDEHKIQKLTMYGKLIASVGQQGSKPLEFNYPVGIAISHTTSHIYIADSFNHRIQVLNYPDLSFSHMFGSTGNDKDQFITPCHIVTDNEGTIYVSDTNNSRVLRYTHNGELISQFGSQGSGPGEIYLPEGLAVNNNFLYIGEYGNHCVSVFTTDGKFVCSFGAEGNDRLNGPRGISMDSDGYLYVCDYRNNRLVLY